VSIPTLQGLQTALSGLMAGQEAVDVTGQNIANAQTPGYSRQTAELQTNQPLVIAALSPLDGRGAQLGTGVGVEAITRIRNEYLDGQYHAENAAFGGAKTLAETLEQLQGVLGEPSSSGLSAQLSSFWSAWNALADAPTSTGAREAVVSAGAQVASTLNRLSGQISAASAEAAQRYATLTGPDGEVRADALQIAELDAQIKLAEQAGQQPNELLDRRDGLIDGLSQLAQVGVSEGEYGTVTVSFGGAAKPLVEGTTVNWPQPLTAAAGGVLGTLISLSEPEGQLAQLRGMLDGVAEALAESVNAQQPRGSFFSFTPGSAAASISVVATLSTLQTGPEGEPGANNLALAVAGLRGGEAELRYTAFVTHVGHEAQTAKSLEANTEAMRSAVAASRQRVSGVSLDEEMTNLMTFQRGYEASARVLTAMDSLLETLIEHTGRVGL
jgi:flagellar hook-associated protein 1 FlgK